ncbi:MAG: hypothetical protein RLZZ221_3038 [Verrucomicrobiota bacterium]
MAPWWRTIASVEQRQNARPQSLEVRERGVEAVLGDERRVTDVALAAEVPFAEMPGGVAGVMQHSREHGRAGVEPLRDAAGVVVGPVVEVRVDAPPLRVLARGDAGPRRGTDRRGDVELAEAEALGRETVDVGRARRGIPEAREVSPPHVIDEHQHDVRRWTLRSRPAGHDRERHRGKAERKELTAEKRAHFAPPFFFVAVPPPR